MLSRVADHLYWFSRYLRRAENTARLVGVGSDAAEFSGQRAVVAGSGKQLPVVAHMAQAPVTLGFWEVGGVEVGVGAAGGKLIDQPRVDVTGAGPGA